MTGFQREGQLKQKQVQRFSMNKARRGDILLGDNDTLPTLSCFGRSVGRTTLLKYLHGKEQDF